LGNNLATGAPGRELEKSPFEHMEWEYICNDVPLTAPPPFRLAHTGDSFELNFKVMSNMSASELPYPEPQSFRKRDQFLREAVVPCFAHTMETAFPKYKSMAAADKPGRRPVPFAVHLVCLVARLCDDVHMLENYGEFVHGADVTSTPILESPQTQSVRDALILMESRLAIGRILPKLVTIASKGFTLDAVTTLLDEVVWVSSAPASDVNAMDQLMLEYCNDAILSLLITIRHPVAAINTYQVTCETVATREKTNFAKMLPALYNAAFVKLLRPFLLFTRIPSEFGVVCCTIGQVLTTANGVFRSSRAPEMLLAGQNVTFTSFARIAKERLVTFVRSFVVGLIRKDTTPPETASSGNEARNALVEGLPLDILSDLDGMLTALFDCALFYQRLRGDLVNLWVRLGMKDDNFEGMPPFFGPYRDMNARKELYPTPEDPEFPEGDRVFTTEDFPEENRIFTSLKYLREVTMCLEELGTELRGLNKEAMPERTCVSASRYALELLVTLLQGPVLENPADPIVTTGNFSRNAEEILRTPSFPQYAAFRRAFLRTLGNHWKMNVKSKMILPFDWRSASVPFIPGDVNRARVVERTMTDGWQRQTFSDVVLHFLMGYLVIYGCRSRHNPELNWVIRNADSPGINTLRHISKAKALGGLTPHRQLVIIGMLFGLPGDEGRPLCINNWKCRGHVRPIDIWRILQHRFAIANGVERPEKRVKPNGLLYDHYDNIVNIGPQWLIVRASHNEAHFRKHDGSICDLKTLTTR